VRFNPAWQPPPTAEGQGWWLLRPVRLRLESRGNLVWTLEVFPRRLIAFLSLLAVLTYVVGATALFTWFNRNPHNQVGWFDLAAPWRWGVARVKRGDTAIITAAEMLREHEY